MERDRAILSLIRRSGWVLFLLAWAALLLLPSQARAFGFGSVPDPCSGGCGCVGPNCKTEYNFRFQDYGRPHNIQVPPSPPRPPQRSPARSRRAKEHERQVRSAIGVLQREIVRVTITQGGRVSMPSEEITARVGDRLLRGGSGKKPGTVALKVPSACTPGTRLPGCGLGPAVQRMRRNLVKAGAEDLRRGLAVIRPVMTPNSGLSDEDQRFLADQAALAMQGLPVQVVIPVGAARPVNRRVETLRRAMDILLEKQAQLSRTAEQRSALELRLEGLIAKSDKEKDRARKKKLESWVDSLSGELAQVMVREEEQESALNQQIQRVRIVIVSGK